MKLPTQLITGKHYNSGRLVHFDVLLHDKSSCILKQTTPTWPMFFHAPFLIKSNNFFKYHDLSLQFCLPV